MSIDVCCPNCGHSFKVVSKTAARREEILDEWVKGAKAIEIARKFSLARQTVLREVCDARAEGDARAAYRRESMKNNWRGRKRDS